MAAGSVFGVRRVDRHKDTLAVCPALKDKLVVRDHYIVIRPVAERVSLSLRRAISALINAVSSFGFGSSKQGRRAIVVVRRFLAFLAPLASVIYAGDARHSEEQPVSQRDMLLVGQDRGQPGDVVVVRERHQMLAPVNAPLLRTVLAVQECAISNMFMLLKLE